MFRGLQIERICSPLNIKVNFQSSTTLRKLLVHVKQATLMDNHLLQFSIRQFMQIVLKITYQPTSIYARWPKKTNCIQNHNIEVKNQYSATVNRCRLVLNTPKIIQMVQYHNLNTSFHIHRSIKDQLVIPELQDRTKLDAL